MQKLLRIKAVCPCHMNGYLCLLLQSFPQREKQSTKGKSSINGSPIALAAQQRQAYGYEELIWKEIAYLIDAKLSHYTVALLLCSILHIRSTHLLPLYGL